jgi:hypothetical protein
MLLLFACTSPAKQEARSLVGAVDRFHKAENPDKPAAADALEKLPCTDEEVCAAKEACVKGTSPMAKALRKQREVEQAIAAFDGSIPKDDPRARALPAELDEVDRLMRESQDAMPACDEKITSLRVKSR